MALVALPQILASCNNAFCGQHTMRSWAALFQYCSIVTPAKYVVTLENGAFN